MWTRNRNDISDRFPDIVAAAAQQLAAGIVLDGQLVILGGEPVELEAWGLGYQIGMQLEPEDA